MIARNKTLRRIVYAIALLTGVVLVGSQFGCAQPITSLRSSGFPCAGPWTEPQAKSGLEARLTLGREVNPPLDTNGPPPSTAPERSQ